MVKKNAFFFHEVRQFDETTKQAITSACDILCGGVSSRDMYKSDDLCTLGYAGHRLGASDATVSKIGGLPVWHSAAGEVASLNPTCASCGGASTLIMQLYAPVETDRSLYIFACERGCAARGSEGWTVIRNQRRPDDNTVSVAKSAPPAAPATIAAAVASAAPSTSFRSVFDFKAGAGGSSFASCDDDDDLADLEKMLQDRDATLQAPSSSSSGSGGKGSAVVSKDGAAATAAAISATVPSTSHASDALVGTVPHPLVELAVDQSEEPPLTARTAREGGGGGVNDDYIKGLVLKYVASERKALAEEASGAEATCDARTLEMIEDNIGRGGSGRGGGSDSSDSSGDDEDEDGDDGEEEDDDDSQDSGEEAGRGGAKGKRKPASSKSSGATSGPSRGGRSKAQGAARGSKATTVYDSGDRRLKGKLTKTERIFKRRVTAAPKQILRYAYEGVPMWCSDRLDLPPGASFDINTTYNKATTTSSTKASKNSKGLGSKEIRVPVCEVCGRERRFEFQLMPAIADALSFTHGKPPVAVVPAVAASNSSAGSSCGISSGGMPVKRPFDTDAECDVVSALHLGMGVLAVYTCSAACDSGRREFCIFQAAE